MQTDEILGFYVTDVTNRLPRAVRSDVGYELKTLLQDELREKIATAFARGEEISEDKIALQLLQNFGHPADVAVRYLEPVTIIHPDDSHKFAFAAIAGVLVIWVMALAELLEQSAVATVEFLSLLGAWWTEVVFLTLCWPGALVVYFAIAGHEALRRPRKRAWQSGAVIKDPDRINRTGMSAVIFLIALGLIVLSAPTRILDMIWAGQAAPAAYQALSYAPEFFPTRAGWLFSLIACNIVIYITLIIHGRWTPLLRRADMLLGVSIALALVWVSAAGNIFASHETDQIAKVLIAITVLVAIVEKGHTLYRELQRTKVPGFLRP